LLFLLIFIIAKHIELDITSNKKYFTVSIEKIGLDCKKSLKSNGSGLALFENCCSQTCVQRLPLGLKKSGRCSKVAIIGRLTIKNFS
jgi:hypothetical protein